MEKDLGRPGGLSSLRDEDADASSPKASIPDADEIEQHILHHPEDANYVVQMPQRTLIEPNELFIRGLGCWVRMDGFSVMGDLGRGHRYFEGEEREQIRRVCEYWKTGYHAKAIETGTAKTEGLGPKDDSAVGNAGLPKGGIK